MVRIGSMTTWKGITIAATRNIKMIFDQIASSFRHSTQAAMLENRISSISEAAVMKRELPKDDQKLKLELLITLLMLARICPQLSGSVIGLITISVLSFAVLITTSKKGLIITRARMIPTIVRILLLVRTSFIRLLPPSSY